MNIQFIHFDIWNMSYFFIVFRTPPQINHFYIIIVNMGSIFIQLGQCGCQIGGQLNPKLATSYYCTRNRAPNRLHALMIDTEPKVIQAFIKKQPRWLDPINTKYFQYGRGNNWSYGYLHDIPQKKYHQQYIAKHKQHSHLEPNSLTLDRYITQNRAISDYIIDRVRHELETVDCAMAINIISSLGGGTGSGLGTKIVQKIREEFNMDIISHVILPNKSGQTPLQVYNCLLSLASIQDNANAIFTYQNDKLMSLFQSLDDKESSLDQINNYLAGGMAKLFRINDLPQYNRFYTNIVSDCILSPQLKYLNLFSAEAKKDNWAQCLNRMLDQVKAYHHDAYGEQFMKKQKKQRLFQGEMILIGKEESQFQEKYLKKYKHSLNPMFQDSFNVEKIKAKGTHRNFLINEKQKEEKLEQKCQAVLVTNHSSILHYLGYLLSSGTKKYEAKAYLWHYQYADIEQAISKVQNVALQYHHFAHS